MAIVFILKALLIPKKYKQRSEERRVGKECVRKTETHDWISGMTNGCKPPEVAPMAGMPKVETSYQLEHYRTKKDNWPFSYLAAGTRDSVKP